MKLKQEIFIRVFCWLRQKQTTKENNCIHIQYSISICRKSLPKSSRKFAKIHKRDFSSYKILQHFLLFLSQIVLAIDWGLNDPVVWTVQLVYTMIWRHLREIFFYFFLSVFFMAWHRKNGYIYKKGLSTCGNSIQL